MSLAIPEPSTPAVVQQHEMQNQAVARLAEWAHSAEAAYAVAERLVQSAFVPAAFKGKPIEATAAILAGSEVGLQPMAALRSFDVIQGSAAPRAITLRAIVQSQGHEMVLIESTATRCVMRGRRRGSSEWQTVTWTMDRARDLGLANKDGWKKQPIAMLEARATSQLARLIAADAILGIGYTVEELTDGATAVHTTAPAVEAATVDEPTTKATPSGTRRMSRKPRTTQPEPDTEPEPPDEPPADELPIDDNAITQPQIKKMAAMMREAGITERQDALDYVITIIGREVASRNDLTKDEASRVIDHLTTMADGPAAPHEE